MYDKKRFAGHHAWQRFMPRGVVADVNWWVDGHAKQYRQQHLEWLSPPRSSR
jgi:hypothetical protein